MRRSNCFRQGTNLVFLATPILLADQNPAATLVVPSSAGRLARQNTSERATRFPHTETLPRSQVTFSPETVTCLYNYEHWQTYLELSASKSWIFTALHSSRSSVVGALRRYSLTLLSLCSMYCRSSQDRHNRAATTELQHCDEPNTPQDRSETILAARKTVPAITHHSTLPNASIMLRRSPLRILRILGKITTPLTM